MPWYAALFEAFWLAYWKGWLLAQHALKEVDTNETTAVLARFRELVRLSQIDSSPKPNPPT